MNENFETDLYNFIFEKINKLYYDTYTAVAESYREDYQQDLYVYGLELFNKFNCEKYSSMPLYKWHQRISILTNIGSIKNSKVNCVKSLLKEYYLYHKNSEVELDNTFIDDSYCIEKVEDKIMTETVSYSINKVLDSLTPREKTVLLLRYTDDGVQSLSEASEHFGVTRERIRQIEAKALRKLSHPSRSKYLKGGGCAKYYIDYIENEEEKKKQKMVEIIKANKAKMRERAKQELEYLKNKQSKTYKYEKECNNNIKDALYVLDFPYYAKDYDFIHDQIYVNIDTLCNDITTYNNEYVNSNRYYKYSYDFYSFIHNASILLRRIEFIFYSLINDFTMYKHYQLYMYNRENIFKQKNKPYTNITLIRDFIVDILRNRYNRSNKNIKPNDRILHRCLYSYLKNDYKDFVFNVIKFLYNSNIYARHIILLEHDAVLHNIYKGDV